MRAQLKGAKQLRREDRPFFVEQVVSDLTNVRLDLNEKDFPKLLVGPHKKHGEILLRQILLKNYKRICSLIMQSIGSGKPASLPIPNSWVNSLVSREIQINRLGSKIALFKFSAYCVLKGIFKTAQQLFENKLPAISDKPYVVFLDLNQKSLPVSGKQKSYDIISWYNNSEIKKPNIKEIWAQIRNEKNHRILPNIIVCRSIFPRFKKLSNYLQYILRSLKSIANAFIGMIRGKWWYGLLYEESVLLHYVSILNGQDLAKEYLLHFSNWFHKPLWTYETEMKGSDISLYYYSTNIEQFNFGGFERPHTYGITSMKWNRFLVWDEQQKDYLKQFSPTAQYQIVGSIDMEDSDKGIYDFGPDLKIAVFDVMPLRPLAYTSLGWAIAPYYSESLSLQFFSDIKAIFDQDKIICFWKQKRIVDQRFISNAFIQKRKRIINGNFVEVDPNISAKRLIQKCDGIISMPFTSTSIIGKELGKPSIYYDPSSLIEKNESHGIPVLKGKNELVHWCHLLQIKGAPIIDA